MDEQVAFFQIAVGDDSQIAPRAKEPVAKEIMKPKAAAQSTLAAKKAPVAVSQSIPAAVRKAANGAGPARRMQTALATAVNADADWKEF
jgi:hypothetical protein